MGTERKMTVSVAGIVLRETAKAIYATLNECHSSAWLPKSQLRDLRIEEEDHRDGSPMTRHLNAEVPVWLWNKLPINTGPVPWATKPW